MLLKSKLTLPLKLSMCLLLLGNAQTAFGYNSAGMERDIVVTTVVSNYPGENYNVDYVRPGYPRPVPIRPRPIPRPPRPVPVPIYPPRPIPYPIPVPVPPPHYPSPVINYKTSFVNRWVFNETFYLRNLFNYGYEYAGYRIKSIRINVSKDSYAQVSLVVNGRNVDTRYTQGRDVYLYPGYYNDDIYSEINSLEIFVNGSAYIYTIVFELERRY